MNTSAEARPLVFVAVGTDFHPFDRMVDWIDRWAGETSSEACDFFVQHGTSRAPAHCPGSAYLAQDELRSIVARSSIVVCHGGPATIMEARGAGKLPICVPRDPSRGEHVDAHQVRFARRVAREGMVVLTETEEDFRTALRHQLESPPTMVATSLARMSDDMLPAAQQVGRMIQDLLRKSRPEQVRVEAPAAVSRIEARRHARARHDRRLGKAS